MQLGYRADGVLNTVDTLAEMECLGLLFRHLVPWYDLIQLSWRPHLEQVYTQSLVKLFFYTSLEKGTFSESLRADFQERKVA